MAKRLVAECDKCGEAREDVRTYTLRMDSQSWEADLDDEHAGTVTIAEFQEIGRQTDSGARRSDGNADLTRRIRGVPSLAQPTQ